MSTTPQAPREFTPEEANALLPTLHRLVSRQLVRQHELEGRLRELHRRLGHLPRELAVLVDDAPEVAALKEEVGGLMQQVDEGWAEVQALGCVVKDPRTGLVDFYGRVDGKLVFLCWRFGEEAVAHYHEIDAGFAGRKPLPAQSRHRLFN